MKSQPHPRDKHESAEEAEANAAAAKKSPTKPWKSDSTPDHPMKHGLLGVPNGKEGYELRWVRYDSVDRRKNQGYELATPEEFDATPDENGMIRRNELVLMMVPTEVYLQRRNRIAKQTEDQTSAPRKEFLREREAAARQSGSNLSDERTEE